MVTVRLISKEEAQVMRRSKAPGVRKQRMREFDTYAQAVLDNPEQAAVFEDLGEMPQKFIFSLRGALRRAGKEAVVRKRRGRDEVRAWLPDAAPPPVVVAPAPKRRGRPRQAR